jgi:parallel beta-helix repeat protein
MTIFRGPGGGGNATTDSELNALTAISAAVEDLAVIASAAAVAAGSSASAAGVSSTSAASGAATATSQAVIATTQAGTATTQAGTATTQASNSAASAVAAANSANEAANTVASKVSSDTLAASGGSALVGYISAGTGAVASTLQAKLRQVISVKDFGAVGNGVTDDTAAIQAAFNRGPLCAIYIPTGIYIVTTLTIGPNVTVYGDGLSNSQLRLKNAATGAILTSSNATRLVLKDIAFDGNYTNCPSGTSGVEISGAESGGTGFSIDRCGFYNAKSIGFYQIGTYSNARVSECIFEGNRLDGLVFNALNTIVKNNSCMVNGRFGILAQGDYSQIMGNNCSGNGQLVTGGAGIGVVTGDYATVSNNTCLSNGTGVFFTHGIQLNGSNNGVMEGNLSQGNNGSGLDMFQSPYTTCTGNQSLNNKVRGIENDTTSTYSTIDGNVVSNNLEVGISVFNTVGSVVSNNIVTQNGTLGIATNPLTGVSNKPYGIALWGAGNYGNNTMVLGNQISQNVGSGANGVGLFVDPACVNVTLTSNQFANNTANRSALKANFKTIKDNQGVLTEQTGTAVLGAAATSVAVVFSPTLGFDPTPSSIKLMLYSLPTANIGPLAITAVSATGFTINVYLAPGGSGVTFDWSVSVFP